MTSLDDIIPIGTKFLIHQENAPIGWTRITGNEYHNAALRVMSDGGYVRLKLEKFLLRLLKFTRSHTQFRVQLLD